MANLVTLQNNFQAFLLTGNQSGIESLIVKDHLSKEKRLKIYFDAYHIRLNEILVQDFPKTFILMGEDLFDKAFLAYLNAYPSTHFSARYFGQHFSQFLKDCSPFNEEPIYAEMAEFEWTLMGTLDAQDAPVANLTQMSTLSPEGWSYFQIAFHPSATLVAYQWDTPLLWKTIDQEEPPRSAVKQTEPQHWIIWRNDLKSMYQSLTKSQAQLFKLFAEGYCFSEILEKLSETMPMEEVPQFAVSHLQFWIQQALVSKIVINGECSSALPAP